MALVSVSCSRETAVPDGPEDLAEGLEDTEKLEVTKKYCNRSLDEIRTLYGECCRAYFIGTAAVHDN